MPRYSCQSALHQSSAWDETDKRSCSNSRIEHTDQCEASTENRCATSVCRQVANRQTPCRRNHGDDARSANPKGPKHSPGAARHSQMDHAPGASLVETSD